MRLIICKVTHCGLYDSNVTIQATNWLADERTLVIARVKYNAMIVVKVLINTPHVHHIMQYLCSTYVERTSIVRFPTRVIDKNWPH